MGKDNKERDPRTGRYVKIVLSAEQLDTVYRLGLIGATVAEVATVINLPFGTVETWTRNDQHPLTVAFKRGRLQGNITIRRKQFQLALAGDGNVTMLIWLGKQLLGQTDAPAMAVNVSAQANVQPDTRTPQQIKDELVELQRQVWLEAKRLNADN